MNSQVDVAREQRLLDLLDEAGLVAHSAPVARRADLDELGLDAEKAGDVARLRER